MSESRLRIVVGGIAGLHPVGGHALHYLQYAAGLARLGHDVYYHEDTWSWPYHPLEETNVSDGSYTARFLRDLFARHAPELDARWHYLHLHEHSFGMSGRAFADVARSADVFVNVGGACIVPEDLPAACVKVFVDTDPGYNQIVLSERFAWSENVERWAASVAAHDRHFTFGENIGAPGCLVPTVGYDWRATRMPIVLDLWEDAALRPASPGAPWTTVLTWNPFKGRVVYRGTEYGGKGSEFERLLDLPARVPVELTVALGGADAPRDRLAAHGWNVVDGPRTTLSGEAYREFIAGSRGEVSPAKHIYAALRTGWFSERSAAYLASGRPVVVQDTGFSDALPVGEGLLAFDDVHSAAEAVLAVEADHPRHAAAARAIAAEWFDARHVLARLVEEAFDRPPETPQVTAGERAR